MLASKRYGLPNKNVKTTYLIQLLSEHEKRNPGSSVGFDHFNYPDTLRRRERVSIMSLVREEGNLVLELASQNRIRHLRSHLEEDPSRMEVGGEAIQPRLRGGRSAAARLPRTGRRSAVRLLLANFGHMEGCHRG